jgi:hypothetical protein
MRRRDVLRRIPRRLIRRGCEARAGEFDTEHDEKRQSSFRAHRERLAL